MKNLSQFKKALTVGSRWKLEAEWLGEQPEERIVEVVQTNAVAFRRPNGKLSWLYFDKAADWEFKDGSAFFWKPNCPALLYTPITGA